MTDTTCAYAMTIDGGLYAHGETIRAAHAAFERQIAGGTAAVRRRLWDRVRLLPLDADAASELAECVAADVIGWE
jgi:hypothetical protein